MFNSKNRSIYYLSLASLMVLSGCWGKKKTDEMSAVSADDNSIVLLSINGTPKITVKNLESDLNELAEMDQQIKMMLMFDPEGTKERIFKEQKRMAIIEEWAQNSGARNNADYQNKKAQIMRHVARQLDFEQFLNSHKVDVTDVDVLDYYNQNKDQDYHILISPAGIKTQTVEFTTKDAANSFLTKLTAAGNDKLEKLANDQKLFVRNLNINENSYADQEIKDAVLKLKKFPSSLIVEEKGKNKCLVVVAQAQEAAKYQEFDKVKDALKQMLMPKKIGEMLEIKIPEYAAQFSLVENTTYFDDLKNAKKEGANKSQIIDMGDNSDVNSSDLDQSLVE